MRCYVSTADFLIVTSNRIARDFNGSGATRAVTLDTFKVFNRVWHSGLLHKLIFYEISGQILALFCLSLVIDSFACFQMGSLCWGCLRQSFWF